MSVRLSAGLAGLIASVVLTASAIAAEPAAPASKQVPNTGASPMPTDPADAASQDPSLVPALGGRLPDDQLPKNDREWAKRLTPEQFQVARKKGTERAFTGKYWNTKTPGTYRCICCGEPLFRSGEKFDSG
jgi:hypothetical protein